MARLHMKFKNIHKGALRAGRDLFDAKPWVGGDEAKQTKFERFLSSASEAYGVPNPTLAIIPDVTVPGLIAPNTIALNKYSVTSLFNAFRQHLQYVEAVDVPFPDMRDAQAWACSLFYTLRPIAFRKAVRANTIANVFPSDLLTSATLASRQSEVDEAFAGMMDETFSQSELDSLEDESADGEDEGTEIPFANPNVNDGRYDRATAARLLGVSVSTVRNMVNDGRLTEVREGRRSYITAASLEAVNQ